MTRKQAIAMRPATANKIETLNTVSWRVHAYSFITIGVRILNIRMKLIRFDNKQIFNKRIGYRKLLSQAFFGLYILSKSDFSSLCPKKRYLKLSNKVFWLEVDDLVFFMDNNANLSLVDSLSVVFREVHNQTARNSVE